MDDWGDEGFKYKTDMIKREGISLAEAVKKKRQNGVGL